MNKIQTLAEYQQLASRTCPDLGSEEKNLLHMNLGITTEVGEFLDVIKKNLAYNKPLDIVNLGEELADMAWYIANKARMFYSMSWEDQLKEYSYDSIQNEFKEIFLPEFKDCSIERKVSLMLGCVINPDASDYMLSDTILTFNGIKDMIVLNHIADLYNLDFMQILTNNISKLQVRYPEKFTNEAALNRNLDAERIELEKVDELSIQDTIQASDELEDPTIGQEYSR